ncbi:hypothetical protein P8452_64751 [Trifolium repens]|nr:hypothetical protein P8452_64751 [Trifolium repens]
MLLYPRNSSQDYCSSLILNIDDTEPTRYFMCSRLGDCQYRLLSSFQNQRCECGSLLDRPVLVQSDKVCEGFVKDSPTFIITDFLSVLPNSMDTNFDLLKSFGIKSTSSLKEMTVSITEIQVLDLLKYSLLSKSPLTDLFLRKEPYLKGTSFSTCDVPNSSSNQIKLKLYLREKDGEILFAQGEEDFADFLFSFLTFPLGGVVRMLGGNSSLGCIDSLYKSILDLDGYKYLMSNEVKNKLVDPCIAPQFKLSKQILQIYEPRASSYYCYCQRSFRESIIHDQFSITYGFKAFNILNETFTTLKLVDPKSSKEAQQEGYVKVSTLFMATNDLVIEPMSPISALSLLNSLETLPSNLTEKVVFIGVKEGLNILKAALTSTSALTNGLSHLLTEAKEEKWYWKKTGSWFRT